MRKILSLFVAAALVGSAIAAGAATAQATGVTLHPGLVVTFSIYGGSDSSGKLIGDYDFIYRVTDTEGGGYRYEYNFVGADTYTGAQKVFAADKKAAIKIAEYLRRGDTTAQGYASFLAVSDATYADLKAGKETPLQFDGPESPKTLKPIGIENLHTMINDKPATVRTIKARASATSGTFWVLDNPGLPLIVRGDLKWKWMVTSISDAGATDKALVASLASSGVGTTHAILFKFNSADIEPGSKDTIAAVAQYLKANPSVRLEIQGHTDNFGGGPLNLALSEKRAAAVKASISAAGIDAGRLAAKGYGLAVPVGDNATPEGRAQNRRVIFKKL